MLNQLGSKASVFFVFSFTEIFLIYLFLYIYFFFMMSYYFRSEYLSSEKTRVLKKTIQNLKDKKKKHNKRDFSKCDKIDMQKR